MSTYRCARIARSCTFQNGKERKENAEKIKNNVERIPISDAELEPWYPRGIPGIVGGANNGKHGDVPWL
ncbi:unnamed protein product [Cylicocyclus nassatus]|uniref:Uncharacterized protein n=1 Tax=Cylicocyclus nassatus TaxID=53992 RepID=A0AA36MET8_CYLNA|nr:unnamed protein product [Cylicocyclus nassatus]